jgi:hypothetical protein
MEKTLVILLGNARGGEQTWKTMYENLLEPYNADLALLFGKCDNKAISLYTKAKYIWELPEYTDWFDYYSENCSGNWFSFFDRNKHKGVGGGIRDFIGSGAIIFAFRHFLKNNFKSITDEYDRIILTRSDYFYIDKHEILPNDKVYITEGEEYGGITDRHHIFPSSYWDKVLGIVEFISSNDIGTENNPEIALKKMFDFYNVPYQKCKRVQFTVATKDDTTRWCKASKPLPNYDGILLKYETEYNLALKNKN